MKAKFIEENKDEFINNVLSKCEACTVGMVDLDGNPYVLPFNFGYKDGVLYIHSGKGGKKEGILKVNNKVCVSFSTDHEMRIQNPDIACSWSMKYRSVLLDGLLTFVDDFDEKCKALNIIMDHYAKKEFTFSKPAVNNVNVMKIEIIKITAKEFGY
ncbi:MAG: MFS transporter [Bacteroidetes bacterium GWE2_29_8]|nr:MAG: MFS transporter [Bacteroidetes bacterium GWE2_29_8]OFY16587.1 MAG: MFS transporter [Bacteroidetes bacterium GWF2_29_10]